MSRQNVTREKPKRQYQMTRRAELEEQTRLRITESTVALHEKVGPAQTSISAVAELAGVRRSTVYRHFPDEESLIDACSAHWRAANPAPDLAGWAAVADPPERLGTALAEMYERQNKNAFAKLVDADEVQRGNAWRIVDLRKRLCGKGAEYHHPIGTLST